MQIILAVSRLHCPPYAVETVESMNFEEQLKQIDICGVAPLRVSSALYNAGALADAAKVSEEIGWTG